MTKTKFSVGDRVIVIDSGQWTSDKMLAIYKGKTGRVTGLAKGLGVYIEFDDPTIVQTSGAVRPENRLRAFAFITVLPYHPQDVI